MPGKNSPPTEAAVCLEINLFLLMHVEHSQLIGYFCDINVKRLKAAKILL